MPPALPQRRESPRHQLCPRVDHSRIETRVLRHRQTWEERSHSPVTAGAYLVSDTRCVFQHKTPDPDPDQLPPEPSHHPPQTARTLRLVSQSNSSLTRPSAGLFAPACFRLKRKPASLHSEPESENIGAAPRVVCQGLQLPEHWRCEVLQERQEPSSAGETTLNHPAQNNKRSGV